MTQRSLALAGSLNLLLLAGIFIAAAQPAAEQGGISVRFSPDGGCAETVVDVIRGANKSLDIAIYHLTHPEIAKAIADAHRRRVTVSVVMDAAQSQASYSAAKYLDNNRVPVAIWKGGMMHNKFMVVDGKQVVTGSFNYTKSADTGNAENLVVIRDRPALVTAYRQQFNQLLRQSEPYRPPPK